jgi:hypothetical protein
MIYTELTTNEIAQAIYADEYSGMSYEGAEILARWLEEIYEGQQWEIDIIAIRCDFTEYNIKDLYDAYSHIVDIKDFDEKDEDHVDQLIDQLRDHSSVVEVNSFTYIVADF